MVSCYLSHGSGKKTSSFSGCVCIIATSSGSFPPPHAKMKNYEFLICKYVSHHLVGPCHETQQDSEKEIEGSFQYNYHFLLWHKCQMSV